MAHEHHDHDHSSTPLRALLIALGITGTVFFAELIGGWLAGSMALMADAMHMLSDAAGLIIAVSAVLVGRRQASAQATYGYRRVEVLAALANAVMVLAISVWIVVEAGRRPPRPAAARGKKEPRAWTIKQGAAAPQAAGVIHTDFEKKFIKAEIVSFDDLVAAGSMAEARANGKVRQEGKDYIMHDGDVCDFKIGG